MFAIHRHKMRLIGRWPNSVCTNTDKLEPFNDWTIDITDNTDDNHDDDSSTVMSFTTSVNQPSVSGCLEESSASSLPDITNNIIFI